MEDRTLQLIAKNRALYREIQERKRAEAELRKVNRAMKMLSECNQILVQATDEKDLLNRICRIIVDVGPTVWHGSALSNLTGMSA